MSYPDISGLSTQTGVKANITYKEVDGIELKLDLWMPRTELGEDPWWGYDEIKKPTLVYFHGGGFEGGDKINCILELLPFMQRKWAVISANYRVADQAKAPAAVEDCRDVLKWVFNNAEEHFLDTENLVIAGESAGAHLAMMTGLLENGDSLCNNLLKIDDEFDVKAIINWYGPTLLIHPDGAPADINWFEKDDTHTQFAMDLSPINHIRESSPPVLTIHGTDDQVVEYIHATILKEKLDSYNIYNELLTIEGKKHGDFSVDEFDLAYKTIWNFLEKVDLKSEF